MKMTRYERIKTICIVIITIAVIFGGMFFPVATFYIGIKRGQVEALSGKNIRYELIERPNGEVRWIRIYNQ